jgi:3-deoxy-D-arabino-heptulosonate 7-phosphate (DAHP) synthase
LCDGPQALLFDQFREMVGEVRAIAQIIHHHREAQAVGASH